MGVQIYLPKTWINKIITTKKKEREKMIYRIYTEDKNRAKVIDILNRNIDGYTLIEAHRCWKKQWEESLIIEIVDEPPEAIRHISRAIKNVNKQEAVLVARCPSISEYI